jgi:hypothetical protein
MQKIKHGIMARRKAGSLAVIAGWQHNAVADGLTEEMTLQGVAIDATLGMGVAEQEREPQKRELS